jgi:hypothetical protein
MFDFQPYTISSITFLCDYACYCSLATQLPSDPCAKVEALCLLTLMRWDCLAGGALPGFSVGKAMTGSKVAPPRLDWRTRVSSTTNSC